MSAVGGPPYAGLCGGCRHAATVASRRSTFLRCRRAEADPAYPRYPRLPVLVCAGFEERSSELSRPPAAAEE